MFIRVFNAQFNRRLPLDSLFFADSKLTEPLNLETPPLNRFGRTYEICRRAPSSYNGQTTRCAAVREHDDDGGRLSRFDFYARIESRYYAPVALGIWCADWEMGCIALGIHGHFAVLSDLERGIAATDDSSPLPRYDVSWVMDE